MKTLLEKSRTELVSKSKKDLKGLQRYKRRVKSHIASSVKQYNRIDMDQFFRKDILNINIEVNGETDNYIVSLSFGGVLDTLKKELQRQGKELELRDIIRAIVNSFNHGDVFVKCTCPDFCLDKDTKIKLLNGENITISDMFERFKNDEELWVYSTDNKGDFKPGKVKDIWISGYTNTLIKITLDNGESILTTPNHRYMLRDGSYCEAKDLQKNQSLMPIYFSYHDGYESYKKNSEIDATKFYSVYKEVAKTCLQKEIEEAKIRSGEDIIQIHHKDFNKLNNYPSNLIPLGKDEHWRYHSNHLYESGNFDKWQAGGRAYWSKQESKDKQALVMSDTMRKYYQNKSTEGIVEIRKAAGAYSQDWKDKISDSQKNVWNNYSDFEYKNRCVINAATNNNPIVKQKQSKKKFEWYENHPEHKDKCRKNIQKAIDARRGCPLTEEHKNNLRKARLNQSEIQKIEHNKKIALSKLKFVFNYMIEHKLNLDESNYYKSISEIRKSNKHRTFPPYQKYFKNFNKMIDYFKLNHKVKSIEYIYYDKPVPVYDLTISDYSNFLTSAGVVLHNCYRFGYWSTVDKYKAGEAELRPSNITNPDNNLGSACKHILLVLSNTAWIIKVASVIKNYIEYMERNRRQQYASIIYPAIYGKRYEKPVQQSIFDTEEDEIESGEETIDTANIQAREKGRFKPGNIYRYQKQPSKDQLTIDELEGDEE